MEAKRIRKSRVSKITVARLFNLGNYEHIRYEITADVPKGGSPKQTLMDALRIVALLKPIPKPYELESYRELLKKDASELTEREKERLDSVVKTVGTYDMCVKRRTDAIEMLDDVGGVSVRTDGKAKWEDDDPPF